MNVTPGSARYSAALRADELRDNKSEILVHFYFIFCPRLFRKIRPICSTRFIR